MILSLNASVKQDIIIIRWDEKYVGNFWYFQFRNQMNCSSFDQSLIKWSKLSHDYFNGMYKY